MSNKRMKVRRESVVECITCSLCNSLLVEATTTSLCLHTFCRICIYKKLADNVFDGCPVCDINLGCNPLDKLRPDHSLQYLRENIFPVNERKVEAPESPQAAPSVSPPAKRKERLLSSLISTSRESVQTSATCRRKLADITKIQVDENNAATVPTKRKRGRPPKQNTKNLLGDSGSPNSMPVAVRHHHQSAAIWFSLVASEDREASHLPQISSGFLRIKDNGMPVSVIQKYIAKRLELLPEEEVQITFQGEPVVPTNVLGNLLELWRKDETACTQIETRVGNSGKDYVMVLNYSRKSPFTNSTLW